MKDWTGNRKSTFATLGASSHSEHDRETNDYYATDPNAIGSLFQVEKFSRTIWEPACGEGHLGKRMEEYDKDVFASDIVQRGGTATIFLISCHSTGNGTGTSLPIRLTSTRKSLLKSH